MKNWYDFTNLKDFAAGSWRLKADGKVIQSGDLADLDLAPGATRSIAIPLKAFQPQPGVEYFLELSFTLKRDLPWAKAATKSPGTNSSCPTAHLPAKVPW